MCFLCTVYVRMQCSVLLYSLLYKYCCTAVWRPPPPQCSYCSRHRLSGRRSYLHPQFTAQLVGACSYWHLGTEHVFLWPCAYYYYFLRLKFLTTKFLTGDAVCIGEKTTLHGGQSRSWSAEQGEENKIKSHRYSEIAISRRMTFPLGGNNNQECIIAIIAISSLYYYCIIARQCCCCCCILHINRSGLNHTQ